MLTRLTIRNFKLFENVEIELGERVVFIGPNNAGKTSALQALALWDVGTKRWLEKRGGGVVPEKRPGVTINRRDLVTVPVPVANLLWRDLRVRESSRAEGKPRTQNVRIEITVEGVDQGQTTLLAYAEAEGRQQEGALFAKLWRDAMEEAIQQVEEALQTLGKDPWGGDVKASDDFLDPLFKRFYAKLNLPNLMSKTDYHVLAAFVPASAIDPEIKEVLDAIVDVAKAAKPRGAA